MSFDGIGNAYDAHMTKSSEVCPRLSNRNAASRLRLGYYCSVFLHALRSQGYGRIDRSLLRRESYSPSARSEILIPNSIGEAWNIGQKCSHSRPLAIWTS